MTEGSRDDGGTIITTTTSTSTLADQQQEESGDQGDQQQDEKAVYQYGLMCWLQAQAAGASLRCEVACKSGGHSSQLAACVKQQTTQELLHNSMAKQLVQ